MTSSPQPHMAATRTRLQVLENEDETLKYSTPSFSSSSDSSFVESLDQSPPFSPSTPLKYRGIPFSWEKIPGIAKQYYQSSKDNKTSGQGQLIPPPPPARNPKKPIYQAKKDPFFAAFLECSRDEDDDDCDDDDDDDDNIGNNVVFKQGSSKITRTLSDRFGLISMYASCKSTCAVSESVVYVPRSRNHPH